MLFFAAIALYRILSRCHQKRLELNEWTIKGNCYATGSEYIHISEYIEMNRKKVRKNYS